jgi:hypothetical protein
MQKADLVDWLTAYKRSWETDDADLFVSLFTSDATYRVSPFAEPILGKDFQESWRGNREITTGNHINLEIWHVEDDVAIVQWIAHTVYFDRGPRQGNGIFRLSFAPDGRCRELREWQHWRPSSHAAADNRGRA